MPWWSAIFRKSSTTSRMSRSIYGAFVPSINTSAPRLMARNFVLSSFLLEMSLPYSDE